MIANQTLIAELDALLDLRQESLDDPYPLYHRLQEEAPVLIHRSMAIVTRHRDIEAVVREMDSYSNRRDLGTRVEGALEAMTPARAQRTREVLRIYGLWLASTDAPIHTRIRTLSHRAFTPKHIARMQELMLTTTDELIDAGTAADGTLEVIDGLAYELPLFVIGSMLGAPNEDRALIRRWSKAIAAGSGSEQLFSDDGLSAFEDFSAYILDLIAERRKTRHTDLLAALMDVREDDDHLSQDELVATFMQLLWAGHETTTNLIGNLLHALLDHPDQRRLVGDDPSRIDAAVEEILRYDTSVQTIHRVPLRDVEIAGVPVPAGLTVRLILGAAGRDPERYDDPDRFDILRQGPHHFGFGVGPHYCLGASLARQETAVAVGRLLERFPRLEPAEPIHIGPHATLRGPGRLRVELNA
jgi:cytochrome P450